ncbi:Aminopyrrolnitrin oxygenase PrnD [Variovorax sp. PBL-H6]|uniref:Rieske 2Fe-2S domain-containing protein n=1 Tax=Variovorax sp. PBL-H6 TaxID=434009 RepID=UPI001316811C|nr:Rieske 2Fe-2S domain-containing protein [Variovorax sp. PBL-H6]VTU23812.1 Aminopyrrolnitrin oxygenase PrnD [Variovorax sp. PBL-H6]
MNTTTTISPPPATRARPTPPRALAIPKEGDDGLFRQSWYPLCLSSEVAKGQVLGCSFLDGKVVAFRGDDGVVHVTSAYCPHVGADLSVGKVVGNNLRCAFHHWEYNGEGVCEKTGIGDPPPRSACLFVFPSQEHWGIVWVFNGEEPLFDLPDMGHPEDTLEIWPYKFPRPFHSDPWVFAANTPDMQHLKAVHGVKFEHGDPHDLIEWDEWGLRYNVKAKHQGGVPIDWTLGLRGTGFFWRTGTYGDFWCAAVTGFGLPSPGMHQVFGAAMVLKGEHGKERLAKMRGITERTIGEDEQILDTIHYRQGTFTVADRTLARYLRIVRDFPRAHPSAAFIR